jgi:hypothetical protein
MDEGTASDIAGLFLCCHGVHRELKAEFLGTVKLLLTAKKERERESVCVCGVGSF